MSFKDKKFQMGFRQVLYGFHVTTATCYMSSWNRQRGGRQERAILAGSGNFCLISLFHIAIVTPGSSILRKIRSNQDVSCLTSPKLSFPREGLVPHPTIPITSSISCSIFPNRVVASRKTPRVKITVSHLFSCRTPTHAVTLVTITVGFVPAGLSLLLSGVLDGLLDRSKPLRIIRHELI